MTTVLSVLWTVVAMIAGVLLLRIARDDGA